MALTQMKPLNVRFTDGAKQKIKDLSIGSEIAESLVARAALNMGLDLVRSAEKIMTKDEFVLYLDKCQRKF